MIGLPVPVAQVNTSIRPWTETALVLLRALGKTGMIREAQRVLKLLENDELDVGASAKALDRAEALKWGTNEVLLAYHIGPTDWDCGTGDSGHAAGCRSSAHNDDHISVRRIGAMSKLIRGKDFISCVSY